MSNLLEELGLKRQCIPVHLLFLCLSLASVSSDVAIDRCCTEPVGKARSLSFEKAIRHKLRGQTNASVYQYLQTATYVDL